MANLYQQEIDWLVSLVTTKYIDSDGLLIQKGTPNTHLLADLGDYIPFFAYLGQNTFCQTQINLLKTHLREDLLKPSQSFFGLSFNTPYEHSDLILGLFDYHLLTKDRQSLRLAVDILNTVVSKFKLSEASSSFYFPSLNLSLSLFDTNDGMYIELLTQAYQITGKKSFLTLAKRLAKKVIKIMEGNRYQLLPHLVSKANLVYPRAISRNLNTITVMKNNTNTIFGLLELYKIENSAHLNNAIKSWAVSLVAHSQHENGSIHSQLSLNNSNPAKGPVTLTSNFAVIDLLCDCYYFIRDPYCLSVAENIGNYWLSKQSLTTGLMPAFPESNSNSSYFDSETDMVIALTKLSQLTKKRKYQTSANKIMKGILAHHRFNKGYYLQVNTKTGKPTNKLVKTKFVCLFIKALILYSLPNKKIYSNKKIFELLKDR